ncbi:four helix bundle protein [Candidatus Wolfebacteria bacterium]|nr:four helix bundle protein [Candidatus Wolfebacteria bacterium]
MKITRFEDLTIWKDSLVITRKVYDLTSKPKFNRDFALRDQVRRAIISISSNIVEGFEKNNNNEFIRFLGIAKGSAGEARNQLYIALTIEYISGEEFDKIGGDLEKLSAQIGAFISYLEKSRKEGKFIRGRIPTR